MIWNRGWQGRQNSCANEASVILKQAEIRCIEKIMLQRRLKQGKKREETMRFAASDLVFRESPSET